VMRKTFWAIAFATGLCYAMLLATIRIPWGPILSTGREQRIVIRLLPMASTPTDGTFATSQRDDAKRRSDGEPKPVAAQVAEGLRRTILRQLADRETDGTHPHEDLPGQEPQDTPISSVGRPSLRPIDRQDVQLSIDLHQETATPQPIDTIDEATSETQDEIASQDPQELAQGKANETRPNTAEREIQQEDSTLPASAPGSVAPQIQTSSTRYIDAENAAVAPQFPLEELRKNLAYPSLARKQGREGLVLLQLWISTDGTIDRIEILEDPGYGMAQAAERAFSGLVAVPAMLDGEPVAVRMRYPVRFSLR
jgi:protein TonB